MIGIIFQFGSEIVEVRINDTDVLFRTGQTYRGFVPIEGLQLNKCGVIKEHPDLKDNPDWNKEAVKRFKEKVKSYDTEKKRMEYIMDDLKKFGYVALWEMQKGHRPIKLKQ